MGAMLKMLCEKALELVFDDFILRKEDLHRPGMEPGFVIERRNGLRMTVGAATLQLALRTGDYRYIGPAAYEVPVNQQYTDERLNA